ncbi:putative acetyltransferase At3g50280 [Bidens hawaiensis]|uniref:putative acetyltransferase At3g50280 n=1 Tax=Bidens hawaiensis TaxID=980011 RepID=UPI0040493D88
MKYPDVEIVSDFLIKPKFVSEEAKKPTYLSPWDLAMISTHYIQKGLLYALPKNQDFSITAFLDDLKDSLSATLTHFHPLAARLSTVKQQNPPSFSVFIDPNNSPGARFIHSSVSLTIADILTPTDVPLVVQSFFDHHKAISHDGHKLSLLWVQVTELVDGIFIGCSVNHMVADGSSFWHFFNSWSEVFRSNKKGHVMVPISRPPVIERWIPAGSDTILTLPFTHEDEFIEDEFIE